MQQMLLLLLCCLALCISEDAQHVIDGGISQLAGSELTHHARVVQTWSVLRQRDDQQLAYLVSHLGCQVYVSFSPDSLSGATAIATVRAIGDSGLVVRSFVSVSSTQGELRLMAPSRQRELALEGYFRVEVIVHEPSLLQQIVVYGAGSVVVDDQVMVGNGPNANMTLKTTGSGSLYLPPQLQLDVLALDVRTLGSGSIHLAARSIAASIVTISVSSSGDIKMSTGRLRVSTRFRLQSVGSGSLYFTAQELSTHIAAISVVNSGDVKIDVQRLYAASDLSLELSGSGNTFLQSEEISAPNVTVDVRSGGDAKVSCGVLTASSSIAVTTYGSGAGYVSALDLVTSQLQVTVHGSGDAVINGGPASIHLCELYDGGSGDLNVGNVVCESAHVQLFVSGDAIVHVTQSLRLATFGRGRVYYVGAAPQSITSTTSGSRVPQFRDQNERVTLSMPAWSGEFTPPSRELTHVLVGDSFQNEIDSEDDDEPLAHGKHAPVSKAPAPVQQQQSSNWRIVLFVVLMVLASVGWGRVEKAWRERRQQLDENSPLLTSHDAPVYI